MVFILEEFEKMLDEARDGEAIGSTVAGTMKVIFFLTMSQQISPYIFYILDHISAFWDDIEYVL